MDLLATGITTGIWLDETVALAKLQEYFAWFELEIEQYKGILRSALRSCFFS